MNKVTTLNQFIIEQQAGVPQATGGFSCLLHHVGIAAKKVNREVNKAGLVDILGRAGSENVQGEDQQKLDIYANETFLSELKASGECCGVASEENQDAEIAIESQDEASAETAESQDEASAETAESQDAAAAQATSPYFTSADGLVKVTTMNTDSANTELTEGYYTFDKEEAR